MHRLVSLFHDDELIREMERGNVCVCVGGCGGGGWGGGVGEGGLGVNCQ